MKISAWIACLALLPALLGMKSAQAQTTIDGGATVNQTSSSVPNPWNITNALTVGFYSAGALNITGGGSVVASYTCNIGLMGGSNGTVTVNGSGSSWICPSNYVASIGNSGVGRLNIINGGSSSISHAWIANGSSSNGSVMVDGAGSTWTTNPELIVGRSGTGEMNISNGGSVSSGDYLAVVRIGSGGNGAVTVDGTNSIWTINDHLYVGYGSGGTGKLDITNGGRVSLVSNIYIVDAYIGSGPFGGPYGNGTVTVDGTGSTLTSDTGEIRVGSGGTGKLHISGGGRVSSPGGYLSEIGDALVTIDGPGSIWTTGYLTVAGGNRLDITDGGSVAVSGGGSVVGYRGAGTATVDGAGSIWTSNSSFHIGEQGTGTLSITGGGRVSNTDGVLGTELFSDGTVTVDGAGSTWINSGVLTVGDFMPGMFVYPGIGRLNITGGGNVSSTDGIIGDHADGTVTVNGAGSSWTNSGKLVVSNGSTGRLDVLGKGRLDITNGGLVRATAGVQTSINGGQGTINIGTSGTLDSPTVSVDNGGVLSSTGTGVGTVTGSVTMNSGATLQGASGGTLTMGALTLGAYSNVKAALGTPSASALFKVNNALTLNYSTVNISDAGGFNQGLYRLIQYGTLIGSVSNLRIGATPVGYAAGDLQLQNDAANKSINLLVSAPTGTISPSSSFAFWDGANNTANNVVNGGSGTWRWNTTNWTTLDGNANGSYDLSALLVFQNSGGTVTVNANGAGSLPIGQGMQFFSGGYKVQGDGLALSAGTTALRVGDGTPAGSSTAAIIASGLVGTGNVEKTDLGTLVLTGANSWTGNTTVSGGELKIAETGSVSSTDGIVGHNSSDGKVTVDGAGSTWTNTGNCYIGLDSVGRLDIANKGSVSNNTGYVGGGSGDGMVRVDGAGSTWINDDVLFIGLVGVGRLDITGGGRVSSTNGRIGDSTGKGTVTINGVGSTWTNSGFIVVGIGGTGALTVANGGSASATSVPVGNAGGTGVVNIGAPQGQNAVAPGTLNTPIVTLGATSSLVFNHTDAHYTFTPQITGAGGVHIQNGTTILAGNNSYSGDTHTYGSGTLDLNGVNSSLASLINDGTVNMGTTPGTKLTAASYSGNGTLRMNVAANGSATDVLVITGTVATTTATKLSITLTGSGQLTTGNGILVVDASAATVGSGAKFLLSAPRTVNGVTYALVKVGKNWYLQGSLAAVGDATAVPTMGEGALALLALMLAGLAAMRRRV